MNRSAQLIVTAALVMITAMPTAWATEKVRSMMHAYVVANDNGQETLQPATTAEPGQTLEYRLTYTNTTAQPVSGLNVVVPVPANTHYLDKSASTMVPGRFQVSLDGGSVWESEPVKRLRKDNNGQMTEVIVPPSEYTHLRWQVDRPLGGGEVQQFSYRVQVL